jgi:hypothetical protein
VELSRRFRIRLNREEISGKILARISVGRGEVLTRRRGDVEGEKMESLRLRISA